MGEWDRARRAYRTLIAEVDPAASAIGESGAVDLRPGGVPVPVGGPYVLSGPGDLDELRAVVEHVTGPGTWPSSPKPTGDLVRATLRLERPAPALALVHAMEGLIDDRTGMWRTWKTTVESVAASLVHVDSLTIEAIIVDRGR